MRKKQASFIKARKNTANVGLQEKNSLLEEKYKRLVRRFKALENKLAKNSSNSSKSPSSDNSSKKKKSSKAKRTTSSRKKAGRKPGGQPGYKGTTLEMSKNPDEIISLDVTHCAHCSNDLRNTNDLLLE